MTIFSTQEGFNSIAFDTENSTYFGLIKGFSSIAFDFSDETYFSIQKGFNSSVFDIQISFGALRLDGVEVDFNGVAFVSRNGAEYSVPIVDGRFVLYPFYNANGAIDECFIVVDAGIYVGELTVTPTDFGVYFIDLTQSTGIAGKEFAFEVIQPPKSVAEKCFCDYRCNYTEKVFKGTDSRTNDTSSFLFKKVRSSDTIALELHRKGSKVADLDDNTFGVYYPSFTQQPLYIGFVIDWGLIFDAYSGGNYTIVAKTNILGRSSTETSRQFYLNTYDEYSANNTVKIEITQNGNIKSNEFDYTNLIAGGWVANYRIPATFGYKTPEFVEDSYLSSSRERLNIQPSTQNTYSLKSLIFPAFISDILSENAMLADRIRITDYQIDAIREYVDFDVFPQGIEKIEESNKGEVYEVAFIEKSDLNIKEF